MSSYIENLKMNEEEFKCFNFGYVNLNKDDVLVLMRLNEDDFNKLYRVYYDLGNSFCRFELLKKILERSEVSLESLKEYGVFRDIFEKKDIEKNNMFNINTKEIIEKLRNIK